MTYKFQLWRWTISIKNNRHELPAYYVDCEHDRLKDLAVSFLDGKRTKGGYEFTDERNREHFSWLFIIDADDCWEIPF